MRSALQSQTLLAGRYRLVRRVGRGATADVYSAEDERLGRPVALKIFHDTQDVIEQQRIALEMRTLASLRHPALITVYDAGVDDVSFLVMELIDGESLRQRLANGPLPPSQVSTVGRCVGEALQYVHANGFVHRDVKPANILLDDRPSDPRFAAKLADFGIARLSGSAHLTSDGTAVGTANYLSPEQVNGEEIAPASDIYSLGLVLLECLTGRPAFGGTGVEAALARLHRDPEIPRFVAPEWRSLLTEMTWRAPAARMTAAEVVARIGALSTSGIADALATAAIATVQPAAADEAPGQQPRHHTAVLPGLPVLAAAAAPPRRRGWLGAAIGTVAAGLVVLMIAIAAASDTGLHVPPPPSTAPVKAVPVTTPATHSTTHRATHAPAAKPAPKPPKHGHGGGGGQADG